MGMEHGKFAKLAGGSNAGLGSGRAPFGLPYSWPAFGVPPLLDRHRRSAGRVEMTNRGKQTSARKKPKAKWATPAVHRLRAGSAEFGLGTIDDGDPGTALLN